MLLEPIGDNPYSALFPGRTRLTAGLWLEWSLALIVYMFSSWFLPLASFMKACVLRFVPDATREMNCY